MTDYVKAKYVELLVDDNGKIWVNVDGKCVLRIGYVEHVTVHKPPKPPRIVYEKTGNKS